MSENFEWRRRRFLAMLAVAPLLPIRDVLASSSTYTLTLTGQALIEHDICSAHYSGFADVVAEIHRGAAAVTDLEAPIHTAESGPAERSGLFLHQAGAAELRCMRELGFNVLTLANNHAGDLGRAGVLATLNAVRAAGFVTAGSGRNLDEASSAARYTSAGEPLSVVAAATGNIRVGVAATADLPGINELRLDSTGHPEAADLDRILASVRTAARNSRVVVCLHNHDWRGDMRVVRGWTRDFAHACVNAGVSAFFAHGAPLLQGIEIYRGAPILYCLGSLIFHTRTQPGHYPPEVWESLIAHLHYRNGRLHCLELVPVVLNEYGDDPARQNETCGRPRLARGAGAVRILTRVRELSGSFGTKISITHERGYVRVDQADA